MREKLETLPVTELREMAKAQGLKGTSGMRKAELVEVLCAQAEQKSEQKVQRSPESSNFQDPQRPQDPQRTQDPQRAQDPQRTQDPQRAQDPQRSQDPQNAQESRPYRDNGNSRSREFSSYHNSGKTQDNSRFGDARRNNRTFDRNGQGKPPVQRSYQAHPVQNQTQNQNAAMAAQPAAASASGTGWEERSPRSDERGMRGDDRGMRSDDRGMRGDDRGMRSDDRGVRSEVKNDATGLSNQDLLELDSGIEAKGILEVMPDGFGFIRCENILPGDNDVYVAPSQIRRFNLKTGDIISGNRRVKSAAEKFAALLYVRTVNGYPMSATERRPNFEDLTPIFPNQRLHMETPGVRTSVAMRVLDLLAPIGKGQRGMIVSPPKAGKTTLLKQVAKAVTTNHPDMHLIILLIDERPEEVTDIKEAIVGPNVEVIYSTFDELPERHKRVSEMVIERAKRLVEHGRDVIILLDSITRLARAYNLTVAPSGRTLSGGLDPAALHMPKRFFGAARNMREGGSLTVLATALVDTGSRMDDVIYEEFKGTGNMELVLDRKLSEKRIFPAVDILKSGTRRDDLLLTKEEAECVDIIHKATNSLKPEDAVEKILDLFARTRNNREFVEMAKKIRFF